LLDYSLINNSFLCHDIASFIRCEFFNTNDKVLSLTNFIYIYNFYIYICNAAGMHLLFWQLLPQANEANIVNNILTPEMILYFILSFSYKKLRT
jgi:hypothetical protein